MPPHRPEAPRYAVRERSVSVRLACEAVNVPRSRGRYVAKNMTQNDENAVCSLRPIEYLGSR